MYICTAHCSVSCAHTAQPLDVLRPSCILQLKKLYISTIILTQVQLQSLLYCGIPAPHTHPYTRIPSHSYEPFTLPPEPLDALFEAKATSEGLDALKARHPEAKPFTLLRFFESNRRGRRKGFKQCTRRTASGLQAGLQHYLEQS